jgi:hypothetical protein
MKIVSTVTAIAPLSRAGSLRRVEKISPSNGLKRDVRRGQRRGPDVRYAFDTLRVSRFETRCENDASENGMPAGFIAQVIGQCLETTSSDPVAARRAYAQAEPHAAATHWLGSL